MSLRNPNPKPHEPVVCTRSTGASYEYRRLCDHFRCPICGRETKQNRNFIAGRVAHTMRFSLCGTLKAYPVVAFSESPSEPTQANTGLE